MHYFTHLLYAVKSPINNMKWTHYECSEGFLHVVHSWANYIRAAYNIPLISCYIYNIISLLKYISLDYNLRPYVHTLASRSGSPGSLGIILMISRPWNPSHLSVLPMNSSLMTLPSWLRNRTIMSLSTWQELSWQGTHPRDPNRLCSLDLGVSTLWTYQPGSLVSIL